MKKLMILAMITTICLISLFMSFPHVSALIFEEQYAGQVCLYEMDFTGSSTDIYSDDVYGLSYLVNSEVIDYYTYPAEKNWLGITTETIDLPKTEVLTYQYPILLDTLGQIVLFENNQFVLINAPLSPEMILDGESYTDTINFSVSNTTQETYRINWGIEYTKSSILGAVIPIYGVNVGLQLTSTLSGYINSEHEYATSSTTSTFKTSTITVSNTSGSTYYQNGDPIYVQFGTRYLYKLQVEVVVKYVYSSSSYVTGSWFTRVTHFNYAFSTLEYQSLYKGFNYFTYYSRYHFPFVYTEDPATGEFRLVDQLRSSTRYYGN